MSSSGTPLLLYWLQERKTGRDQLRWHLILMVNLRELRVTEQTHLRACLWGFRSLGFLSEEGCHLSFREEWLRVLPSPRHPRYKEAGGNSSMPDPVFSSWGASVSVPLPPLLPSYTDITPWLPLLSDVDSTPAALQGASRLPMLRYQVVLTEWLLSWLFSHLSIVLTGTGGLPKPYGTNQSNRSAFSTQTQTHRQTHTYYWFQFSREPCLIQLALRKSF